MEERGESVPFIDRDTGQASWLNYNSSTVHSRSASSGQGYHRKSESTWKVVRVILEYVMFLHDAIGVGLFVVIAHHVGKSADCTESCSPVNESIKMAKKTLRTVNLSNRSAAASKVYTTTRLLVDGRGKVRRRFIGKRANGFLSSGLAPAVP